MTEQVLAVQRMQDYIEKSKTEEISLSDLARASLFSPWYAYRLFRDCLGLTPTEYIRKCTRQAVKKDYMPAFSYYSPRTMRKMPRR